ncbi:uncharacterized protein [Spinacia oleracea]|uniref:Reverse transcriptase domain-containing protein n=1 Tax=Spinacia oleracea TaxID=3562 RepID=A0ABM3QR83_SPIOL|nr:uncharacterized protein LOC130461710 [Spinacia oleracea]
MRGQKDYAKRLGQVMLSGKATADPFPKVEIGEADRGKVATPHDDPLVIELKVANLRVRRILVDTWSLSDIISLECLNRLQHDSSKIEKIHYPIIGFGVSIIHPVGIISLPLRMGNKKESLQMDFVCDDGIVSTIHGDQQQARDCYLTTLSPEAWGSGEEKDVLGNKRKCDSTQSKSLKETLTISATHMEERRPKPVRAHYNVVLNADKPDRVMPGIDPAVAVHKLNVDQNFKPVRQKKRNHGEDRNQAATAEVKKLMDAGFVRPSQYPDWVANVVLVPKPNDTWRMCFDYTNLNKACPKDSFPLPKIDRLVDSTAGL